MRNFQIVDIRLKHPPFGQNRQFQSSVRQGDNSEKIYEPHDELHPRQLPLLGPGSLELGASLEFGCSARPPAFVRLCQPMSSTPSPTPVWPARVRQRRWGARPSRSPHSASRRMHPPSMPSLHIFQTLPPKTGQKPADSSLCKVQNHPRPQKSHSAGLPEIWSFSGAWTLEFGCFRPPATFANQFQPLPTYATPPGGYI
jgi:hypothetical protein